MTIPRKLFKKTILGKEQISHKTDKSMKFFKEVDEEIGTKISEVLNSMGGGNEMAWRPELESWSVELIEEGMDFINNNY